MSPRTIFGKSFNGLTEFAGQFEDAAPFVVCLQKVEGQKEIFNLLVRVLALGVGCVVLSLASELEELFGKFGDLAQICGTGAVGRLRALPLLSSDSRK